MVIGFGGSSAPIAYVIATGILLAFAAGLATMSRFVPNPGAFYAYVTSGLGKHAGLGGAFLAIFAYWLIATATYAFFGSAANRLVVGFGGPDIAWYWWQILGWACVGFVGYRNIELSAKVLTVAMVLEVAIVVIFDFSIILRGGAEGLGFPAIESEIFSSGNIAIAVLFSVLCFIGFESTAIFREEAKNPEKTVPRAMYLSVLLVGIFYAISVGLMILAYGQSKAQEVAAQNPAGMFDEALGTYAGAIFRDICAVLLLNSVLASVITLTNMLSRYLYALGNDGVLPKALGQAHPKHRSPYRASLVVTAMIGLLGAPFMFISAEPMVFYANMVGVGMYALTVLMVLASVAVLVFFRRNPQSGTSVVKTTVAPAVSIISFAFVLYLATTNMDLISGLTGGLAVALVVVTYLVIAAGIAVAAIYRRARPEAFRRIGRQEL
ncbi:putative amino acid permease [Mycolicibacterium litorale]|uniref:Putative amino acid permease n=1 Tax=Mycolicibacterium litorale TaxID=758802 RepID=A0A6S6PAZ9_9MYCO|nr:putative amino acid permease [Mycolicibacterium litorale]